MNNAINSPIYLPELGTLEDLLIALRVADPDHDTDTFASAMAMEEYHNVVNEVATLKGTPDTLPL